MNTNQLSLSFYEKQKKIFLKVFISVSSIIKFQDNCIQLGHS